MAKRKTTAKYPWTREEYREFKGLVDDASSRVQMDRIRSRLKMPKFIERVGKEKCDLMFAFMTRNDRSERA